MYCSDDDQHLHFVKYANVFCCWPAVSQGWVLNRKIVRNKDEGDKHGDEDFQSSILQNIELVMYCTVCI